MFIDSITTNIILPTPRMFFRALFMGFFMDKVRHSNILRLSDTYQLELPYQSNDQNIKKHVEPTSQTFVSTTGKDMRFNETEDNYKNTELLCKIKNYYIQLELLRKLENDNLQNTVKLKMIEEYNLDSVSSSYAPNYFKGLSINDF